MVDNSAAARSRRRATCFCGRPDGVRYARSAFILLTASHARKLSGLWRRLRCSSFMAARRTKTPNSGCYLVKACDFEDGNLHGCRQDELSDPRPALDRERLGAEIGENDVQLAAVIGIERARRIEHCDAEVQCEPGTRPDLTF